MTTNWFTTPIPHWYIRLPAFATITALVVWACWWLAGWKIRRDRRYDA